MEVMKRRGGGGQARLGERIFASKFHLYQGRQRRCCADALMTPELKGHRTSLVQGKKGKRDSKTSGSEPYYNKEGGAEYVKGRNRSTTGEKRYRGGVLFQEQKVSELIKFRSSGRARKRVYPARK